MSVIVKCKGLRAQLAAHEKKLRDFIANPGAYDNKGFQTEAAGKGDFGLVQKIIAARIAGLQAQIANFRKLLEECEKRNGLGN